MSIRLRSTSAPNEETFNELTYDEFWNQYFNQIQNNLLFEEAIKHHLTETDRSNEEFFERTRASFVEWDIPNIAAVAELLSKVDEEGMLPVVKQLAYTVERQRTSFASLANSRYLKTVVSCIAKYSQNYCGREDALQDLMRLPMPYQNLETLTEVIIIIERSLSSDYDASLDSIGQLTASQDTIRNFMELARDVIHPCVVAEIALKWGELRGNATDQVIGIIRTLLNNLREHSGQWYNSVCTDIRYKAFIQCNLELLHRAESSAPQILDDVGKNDLISCINEGNGEEREFTVERNPDEPVRGFSYKNGELPPYGDTLDHWFINAINTSKHLSFIVDSKDVILRDISDENEIERIYVSLCRVPGPNTLQ